MENLKFDANGLITAVVQDAATKNVLMVAWMNAESLERTLETGETWFWSRSRAELWHKGETSSNIQKVVEMRYDCDGDTLLVLVDPHGPSCHTGRPNCFFRQVGTDGTVEDRAVEALPFLDELAQVLHGRRMETSEKSYTRSLLDGGAEKIGGKVVEEANELSVALASESDDRVTSEAADLLFHLLVGLELRGVPLRSVIEVLAERSGIGGHAEKTARKAKS
jgi:phosphoribosyl-ATP pyrophosphohydrolase/phosphoribosyl-AMP cyclohydrolase